MSNSFAILPVPAGNGTGAAVDVSEMGAQKTILIDGSFDAILTIEASGDGINFGPVASAQGGGLINKVFAAQFMRVSVSGYRNGAPTVQVGAPDEGAASVALNVTPGNGTGTTADIGAMGRFGTLYVVNEFGGTVLVEVSDDDVSYSPLASFQGPTVISKEVTANFMRVVRSGVGFNPGVPSVVFSASGGNGDSPTPPFPDPQIRITIYARLTGNDVTGNGTLANPYRTLQRAVRDVPYMIPPGVRYFVDVTGIGQEVLPNNYALPAWKAPQGSTFVGFFPEFAIEAAVNILAFPQRTSAVPLADSIVTALEIVATNFDPISDMLSIQTTKVWPVGGLIGNVVVGAGGETMEVWDNTADTLFLTATSGGVPTAPFEIMEQSAEFITSGDEFLGGGFNVKNVDSLTLNGLKFTPSAPFPSVVQHGGHVVYTLCDMSIPLFMNPIRHLQFFACNLSEANLAGETYIAGSRVTGPVGGLFGAPANVRLSAFDGTIFDNCDPIVVDDGTTGIAQTTGFATLANAYIRNPLTDGFVFSGGRAALQNVRIDGAPDAAVRANVPGLLTLSTVGGTGNGTELVVENGAFVEVNATTFDAAGDEMTVGDLAVRTFADFRANPPVGQQYDITAVAAAGATGTGSRVFQP